MLRAARLGTESAPVDVVVANGRIAAIRPSGEAGRRPGAPMQVVDLDGRAVLPGLWDGHVHSRQWALRRDSIDLSGVPSAELAAERVEVAGAGRPFVLAFGAAMDGWGDMPDKSLLARVREPVVIQSRDLHTAWLNDAALDLVGLAGHPDGLLREAACFEAVARLCADPLLAADDAVLGAMREAAALGVVGIVDFEMADNVGDWVRRAGAGELPVRVECSIPRTRIEAAIESGLHTGDELAAGVRVGPVKLFLDGSLTSGTALVASGGAPLIPAGELRELVERLAAHRLTCAIHAIGEGANRLALDAFAGAGAPGRIEHAQLLHPEDVARFAELGVVASVQPAHLCVDRDLDHWSERGTEGAYGYASLLRAGARLEFGSDAPVVPLNPWATLAAAVDRTADDRAAWLPDERVGVREALRASTRGREMPRVGEVADLVVLEASGLSADSIAATEVHATLCAGRWSYRS
jgi:predicted amidohydrolase YtcJ